MTDGNTDTKRKEQAPTHPNLGQDEAAEERRGKTKMEHMEGAAPRRERASTPRAKRQAERARKA